MGMAIFSLCHWPNMTNDHRWAMMSLLSGQEKAMQREQRSGVTNREGAEVRSGVKPAINGSKFIKFIWDQPNFDSCMGTLDVQKYTYQSTSAQPACWINAPWSVPQVIASITDQCVLTAKEASLLSEYNSSAEVILLVELKNCPICGQI